MCYTKISTYYCSSPSCLTPSEVYNEQVTYTLCAPSYIGRAGDHVDYYRSNPDLNQIADRSSYRVEFCNACVTTGSTKTKIPVAEAQTSSIVIPTPEESATWLCTSLKVSLRVQNLAVELTSAIYALGLDGDHYHGAVIAAAVYTSSQVFAEPIKFESLEKLLQADDGQIKAAYAMLYENRGRLSVSTGGGGAGATWVNGARTDKLPKPTRSSKPEREHWMM